jgi:hypothetical protein
LNKGICRLCSNGLKSSSQTVLTLFHFSYGKWHMPQPLIESKDGSRRNVVQYNDFDYSTQKSFYLYDADDRKYDRYLEDTLAGPVEFVEGEQMDPFSGCTVTIRWRDEISFMIPS